MFGSDWPVCKMSKEEDAYATQIALLKELTAHLNNEEKDNVFYKTAEKFYGLFDWTENIVAKNIYVSFEEKDP